MHESDSSLTLAAMSVLTTSVPEFGMSAVGDVRKTYTANREGTVNVGAGSMWYRPSVGSLAAFSSESCSPVQPRQTAEHRDRWVNSHRIDTGRW